MHISDLVATVSTFIGAVGGASGIYAFVRFLPKVIDRSRLIAENAGLREQVNDLTETLTTLKSISDANRAAVDELKVELAVAVTYIVDLVLYLKRGGVNDFPTVPPELQRLLQDGLSRRADSLPSENPA